MQRVPIGEMLEHNSEHRVIATAAEQDYYARIGKLILRVPQSRDGGFSTELFSLYQRSEQALVLSMMEMVLQGVGTRKVERVTEELCGENLSKSMVADYAPTLILVLILGN